MDLVELVKPKTTCAATELAFWVHEALDFRFVKHAKLVKPMKTGAVFELEF